MLGGSELAILDRGKVFSRSPLEIRLSLGGVGKGNAKNERQKLEDRRKFVGGDRPIWKDGSPVPTEKSIARSREWSKENP